MIISDKLYYIVSLHQTTTRRKRPSFKTSCIISFLYIKPQPKPPKPLSLTSCIISFLYIKPQLTPIPIFNLFVVLYRFSTSNHNRTQRMETNKGLYYIVSLHQTTTGLAPPPRYTLLYYIVSLHQTTTNALYPRMFVLLYYIVSLHQTTTLPAIICILPGCIISFLYIKPQLPATE